MRHKLGIKMRRGAEKKTKKGMEMRIKQKPFSLDDIQGDDRIAKGQQRNSKRKKERKSVRQ